MASNGWEQLGAALGGDSEAAYQKGRALGAQTEAAIAKARAERDETEAKMQAEEALVANGVPRSQARAMSTIFRGGGNIGDLGQAMLHNQEYDFRARAGDPSTDPAAANAALRGVASGPVEQFYSVGPRAYASKFSNADPQPLGDAMSGGGGGDAASIQLMRAFGFLDPSGQIKDINGDGRVDDADRRRAFDLVRTTGTTVEGGGGVRYPIDFNPFSGGPVAAPRPASSMPPPAAGGPPAAPTVPAGPVGAPSSAPGTVVPPSAVMQNTADAEAAKKIGAARGEAMANMPQNMARLRNQTEAADYVLAQIDKALPNVDWSSSGLVGALMQRFPGSSAYNLVELLAPVKANIGFQGLQQMRYESPTGGALGQVAVQELTYLQSAWGNLNTAQTPEQLVQAMQSVRQHYVNFKRAAAEDFAAAQAQASGAPLSGASAVPAISTPVTIKTDAEYNALPSGAEFYGPDGQKRRKP